MNVIDFSKLGATLEPYGDNLILKLFIKPEAPVDRDYLSRAVTTLLNFGAIDFIPTAGEREYENLRPYDPARDDYAMLQTNRVRLKKALDILGYLDTVWAFDILATKRDKKKKKIKSPANPFWDEAKKAVQRNASAFVDVSPEYRAADSTPPEAYAIGSF